tara:strand:- start:1317 stop:1724 length:408 start_codon:yes stop_codon:yes gene_type:complete
MGMTSSYTIEIAERICEEIAKGKHLHLICQTEDWTPTERTVHRWLNEREDFRQLYARAREEQQEVFAAQVITIADTEKDSAKARNMMDARKWYAARVAPRKWGDRVEIDAKVETTGAASEALLAFLGALEAKKGG